MLDVMARNWWMILIRGIAAILFGLALLFVPGLAVTTFVLLFGAYSLVDGVFTIIYAIQHRQQPRWWVHLLQGIVSVLAGIVILIFPVPSTITISLFVAYLVAFWAIVTGVTEIIWGFQMRREIEGEFWIILSGIVSVIFGVLMILNPGAGIEALLTIVGIASIVFGIVLIIFAFRVRGMGGGQTPNRTQATV